jgi:hypothetical protein
LPIRHRPGMSVFSHYLLHGIDVVSSKIFLIFREVRLQIFRHRVHAVKKGIECPVVAKMSGRRLGEGGT